MRNPRGRWTRSLPRRRAAEIQAHAQACEGCGAAFDVAIPALAKPRRSEFAATENGSAIDKTELLKLQDYLRRLYGNAQIKVVARPKKTDSAEVMIGDEFVGIISLDDEDGDRSFVFTMSILEDDLAD